MIFHHRIQPSIDMQFKVPQDVQQADRIVWFLTLPQLIICVVGFAIAYAIYSILNQQGLPIIIWLPPVAIVALLTAAFAFLKIANLPFYKYLALVVERLITPSKRVWVKGADRVLFNEDIEKLNENPEEKKKQQEEELQASKEERLQNIGALTEELDRLNQEKEAVEKGKTTKTKQIDESSDEGLIQKAFLDKDPQQTPAKEEEKSTEDKILELSKHPEFSVEKTAKDKLEEKTETNTEEKPKKKRRRRRRRKKKNTETQSSAEGNPVQGKEAPTEKATNDIISKPEDTSSKTLSQESPQAQTQENETPLPAWLTTPPSEPETAVRKESPESTPTESVQTEAQQEAVMPETQTVSDVSPQDAAVQKERAAAESVAIPEPVQHQTLTEGPHIEEKTTETPLPEWLTTETADPKPVSPDEQVAPEESGASEPSSTTPEEQASPAAIPVQNNSKPAAVEGEFTPEQLQGEGQVITFDAPKTNNDQ